MTSRAASIAILFLLAFFRLPACAQNSGLEVLLQKIKGETNIDSLRYLYDDLGKLYFYEGNFVKAQESFLSCLRICEKKGSKRGISSCCNNIACVYNEMGNGKDAIPFADRAIKEATGTRDSLLLSSMYNTLGQACFLSFNYPASIQAYERSIAILLASPDSLEAGTAFRNLGAAYLESGNPQKAIGYFKRGLNMRMLKKDTVNIFSNCSAIAELYNSTGQFDSSAVYIDRCTQLLPYVSNALHLLREYHYVRYYMYAHTGRLQDALSDLEKYHQFKDSIMNEDNLASLSEEKSKYLLEKKEQEVAHQRDIAVKEKNARVMVSLLLLLSVISLVIFIFWLRARQQQKLIRLHLQQQEAERSIMIEGQEGERKRIAKELHDGIVQDLTAIAINLQARADVNRGELINKITQAAHEARNLAHQMMPVSLMQLGLINALEDLFQQSYTPLGIGYEFEHFANTSMLNDAVSVSLYRICQELVANSVKHSGANLVHILLRQTDDQLMLVFEDNGKGFDIALTRLGIGMVSITSRVSYLNGKISFDSAAGSGATVIIKIPLVGR